MMRHGIRYRYAFKCKMCERWTLTNIVHAGVCDDCMDAQDGRIDDLIALFTTVHPLNENRQQ